MFYFKKLKVYQNAIKIHVDIYDFIDQKKIKNPHREQLERASLSTVLNIAEGTGRFSVKEKKRFLEISRTSVFECVAVFDCLTQIGFLPEQLNSEFEERYEEQSRMIMALRKSLGD